MSLKAYDGMMSRKSIKYIQDEIVKRMDRFKEASENKLAKSYAEAFVNHIDKHYDVIKSIEFDAINEVEIKEKIKKIEINDDTTILSYLFQASKILSKGTYLNDFMAHLNISIQAINSKKILVYPNIIVHEHKPILLEFLEDWYCQNQCDPDENVSRQQWKQREKDWYAFDEVKGFNIKIQLFDPNHYWNSLNDNFRGTELVNKILKFIPSEETRIRRFARNSVINKIEKEAKEKGEEIKSYDVIKRLTDEGNTEIDDYIKSHNIQVTPIDADLIGNLKFELLKAERKEKLDKINTCQEKE